MVVVASGWSYPDIAIAVSVADWSDGYLLWADRKELGAPAERIVDRYHLQQYASAVVIDSSGAVSQNVVSDLEKVLGLSPGSAYVAKGDGRIDVSVSVGLDIHRNRAQDARYKKAVASITPGEADCDNVTPISVPNMRPAPRPYDPADTAEVVRIVDGCLVIGHIAMDGRTIEQMRAALFEDYTVFAVSRYIHIEFEPDM